MLIDYFTGGVTHAWLQKEDNVVKQTGEPTWRNLIFALQTIRQSTLASTIINEKEGTVYTLFMGQCLLTHSLNMMEIQMSTMYCIFACYHAFISPQEENLQLHNKG